MAKELFANQAAAFLAAGITATDTTLTLTTASNFPTATGQFTVRVGGEICLATAFNAGTLVMTIVRGQEGTPAVSHTAGEVVFGAVTDASIRRLARQSLAGTNISARREVNYIPGGGLGLALADDGTNDKVDLAIWAPYGGIIGPIQPPPQAPGGAWIVVNSAGSFSSSYANGALSLVDTGPTSSQTNLRGLFMAAPATPYTITAAFHFTGIQQGIFHGLAFRESSTSKIYALAFDMSASVGAKMTGAKWDTPTSVIGTSDFNSSAQYPPRAIRVSDDGANLKMWFSGDGVNFYLLHSASRTAYQTGGPDQVGLFLNQTVGGSYAASTCYHWVQG